MQTRTGMGAVVVVALACVGCGRSGNADARELIAAYTRATCVAPQARETSDRTATRTWKETFDLGSDVKVVVDASCSGGGAITGKYSDEPGPRTIASGEESMSPCDLRIDWMQMRLYVRTEGPIGASQRMALHEYDLQTRRSPRESAVDPALLPQRCEIASSK